eukprot:GHVS01034721.1.p1 GENE.GHVS01034721.1~~GHVS01034721.1.p1  ORF type:complete len:105 (-),score=5.23 GHVS01034721.1:7-321(-)
MYASSAYPRGNGINERSHAVLEAGGCCFGGWRQLLYIRPTQYIRKRDKCKAKFGYEGFNSVVWVLYFLLQLLSPFGIASPLHRSPLSNLEHTLLHLQADCVHLE